MYVGGKIINNSLARPRVLNKKGDEIVPKPPKAPDPPKDPKPPKGDK